MKHLALMAVVVCLAAGSVSAQLAYYLDERGRRVYVNDSPKPQPLPAAATKAEPVKGKLALKGRPATARNRSLGIFGPPAGLAAVDTPPILVPPVDTLIQQTADKHSVDANLVRAIVRAESNFNPRAVSRKGAMGLMQLVPGTARQMGVHNVFNPAQNVEGGVRYLKGLLETYGGNLTLSLAAYNAGPGAVQRYGGVPPYRETRDYVKKVGELYNTAAPKPPAPERWRIVRTVDENGRVLYTNQP